MIGQQRPSYVLKLGVQCFAGYISIH